MKKEYFIWSIEVSKKEALYNYIKKLFIEIKIFVDKKLYFDYNKIIVEIWLKNQTRHSSFTVWKETKQWNN